MAEAHLDERKDYYVLLDKYVEKGNHKTAMDFTGLESVRRQGKKLDDRELARALRLAISAEHDAVHLYELIADSTGNAKVKKVVSDVADEEKVHKAIFSGWPYPKLWLQQSKLIPQEEQAA